MPFIDSKVTVKLTDQQKEEIKSELGKLIKTLNKSESYLMVGIEDSADLWLGGKKLDRGAYIAVSLYGDAPGETYDRLTGQICALLSEKGYPAARSHAGMEDEERRAAQDDFIACLRKFGHAKIAEKAVAEQEKSEGK